MAWNEPGGNNDKDPWGGDQGPPDLDEAFKKFKEKFSGGSGGGGSKNDMPDISAGLLIVITVALVLLWFGFGFYTVDQQEKAVILRFGKYIETVDPGLNWYPPLIESKQLVNVTNVRSQRIGGLMLTKDDNIVEVSLSVQYTVSDPKAFLLEVRDPERSLEHAAESAVRHVVGGAILDQILTEGRELIAIELKERLQSYLNNYNTGIAVATVNIEDAQPPKEVQASFDDVIRAKEDEQRLKNEAQAYENGIIPEARGFAQRQIEESNGYKSQVVARAEGEAARFISLLSEYEKAPEVTRKRLYIDTMQRILGNSSKVMIDVDGGNLLYLPLDKLMGEGNKSSLGKFMGDNTSYNESVNAPQAPRGNRSSSRRESR